jgi:Protein of unknown function (DUF2934)
MEGLKNTMNEPYDPFDDSSVFRFWLAQTQEKQKTSKTDHISKRIAEAIQTQDSQHARDLAAELEGLFDPDSDTSVRDAHLLSEAYLLVSEPAKADSYIEFAMAVRAIATRNDDPGEIVLSFAKSRIKESSGQVREACEDLTRLIDQCIAKNQLDLIHALVLTQAVFLNKLNDVNQIFELLKRYLPLVKKYDCEYRDTLRTFWKFIANKHCLIDEHIEIVRLILNNDVNAHLQNEQYPSPIYKYPQNWHWNGVSKFLQDAESNTVSTLILHRYDLASLSYIDARFSVSNSKTIEIVSGNVYEREKENMTLESIVNTDWAEIFFLMGAHSSFLGACRLATSAQYAETHMLLRGLLENALYCFGICENKKWRQIWFDRHNSAADYERCKKAFNVKTIQSQIESKNQNLAKVCVSTYDQLIDSGAHPNARVFSAIASASQLDDTVTFSFNVLSPDRINELLATVIDVSLLALEIFSLAMPNCVAAPSMEQTNSVLVADRAYERWCERGYGDGNDLYDWHRATADLKCRA